MHPNFGVPVPPSVSNNPFFQQNPHNFNPNGCSSMPMFQMNSTSQFLSPNHQNSQHVLQSNSGFPGQAPSSFIPDLQVIKTVPPPSFMPPAPPLPGNHVPEIPAPTWNSTQMINNNNQAGQFQGRPPSAPHFPPPMFPSNNYNNINAAYSSSNGFNGQQNSFPQTANAFQRNQTTINPFANASFNSSVQSTSNSFGYASNGVGRNQNKRKAAFSNDRNSSNFNQDSRDAKRFRGCNSMQSDSKQTYWPPSFRDCSNIPQNGYEQYRQESPFMGESNGETAHNGNKFYHNRGKKRGRHPSNGSYSNNKEVNSHSAHQGNGHNYVNAKNGYKKMCLKSERNSDPPKLHSCDTCDRAFASESELQYHLSEHIKCDSGDCQFEAHPKIVALHKKMQHDTGYADAISKLKNADEIEKWRAERRRRFPTLENIEKRKAEQAEKEARGEVIENKEFGKFGGRNSQPSGSQNNDGNGNNNPRKRRRGPHKMRYAYNAAQYPHSVAKRTVSVSDSESDSDDDSHIKLPTFLGIAALDTPENENLESHSHEISSNSHELSGMASLDSPENENLESQSQEMSSNSHELSDNMPHVESVDPMENPAEINTSSDLSIERVDSDSADDSPIELHVEENTLENESIGRADDLPQRNISNSVVDLDIDDEPPTEIPITKRKGNLPQNQVINTVIDADIDDEAPIEIPIAKSVSSINGNIERDSAEDFPVELHAEPSTSGNQSTKKEPKNGRRNSKGNFNGNKEYPELPRKSSLLEKLLSDDIRHERNVIMQCIRHIVKKNFFDVNVNN